MADTAIRCRALRKSYGAVEAVSGIDIDVFDGEVFGFLGPNGAGKTTTIEILEGYRDRSAGEVSVLGVDPARPTRQWRDRVGLVLQECELDPVLTVTEILSLFASFYTSPRPVNEVVELVGLADKSSARIGSLSGGQRRRADVAVALIGDPDLIFLDEPTTGFDPSARRDAWGMIRGLQELGKTIFLTTHYMDEAQHLADRVAILRAGKLVATGRPDQLGRDTQTVVSFRVADQTSIDQLRAAVDGAVFEQSGTIVSVRTDNPQRTLYRLTACAEQSGVTLEGLEAHRPDLEEIFLELTGPSA